MPLRRLLGLILNNAQLIEQLSETKLMRRAAQITVGLYTRLTAGGISSANQMESKVKKKITDFADAPPQGSGFFASFREELAKEQAKMKRDGKL
uniref:Uncharacterized protein NCBP2-AS2-like n=1 Tax=Phallusia mammillata TaxID=59560 RepID=A0A6F9D4T6_9ASCI|nr:uncharacterized protein NCBP2-AS2-like [Phallusia mammillata]